MSDKSKKGFLPKLRFPDFRDAGDWNSDELGRIADIYQPVTIPQDQLKSDGAFFVYGANGIIGKLDRYNHDTAQIAITCRGSTCGTVTYTAPNSWITGNAMVVNFDHNSSMNKRFFYYLFINTDWKYQITGSGQPQITGTIKKHITIFPKPEEQQKIADCLSSLDELIEAEDKKLKALQQHKQGLMQELFPAEGQTLPKRRFPEFQNAPEWEKKPLIDVINKNTKWSFTGGPFGSNLKSSDYMITGVRIIQLQNIGDGEFLNDYKIFTSEEKANELLSCNIYPGEIILSKMGDPVARACLIPEHHHRYVMCSDGIRLAVDKKRYDNFFVYSLINSARFRKCAEKAATGSTRKRIGIDVLRNLNIIVPQLTEQQIIAQCLFSIDELIIAQRQKLDVLRNHKKGLMQQLFPAVSEVEE